MPNFSYFKVIEYSNGVTLVKINRPQKHNSFKEATWREYHRVFKYLATETSTKVIILSGVGRSFCAGLDLSTVSSLSKDTGKVERSSIEEFQRCINAPVEFDIPVISVSHGVSYGLALDIISATSIRIASRDTRFSIKEIDIGIMADIGSLQRIPSITGNMSTINELALTGRDFSADEARAVGLVSDVLDTKEEALKRARELAEVIVTKYTPAIKGTKRHLDLMTTGSQSVKNGLNLVAVDNANLMNSPGYMKFFMSKFGKMAAKL